MAHALAFSAAAIFAAEQPLHDGVEVRGLSGLKGAGHLLHNLSGGQGLIGHAILLAKLMSRYLHMIPRFVQCAGGAVELGTCSSGHLMLWQAPAMMRMDHASLPSILSLAKRPGDIRQDINTSLV